MKPTPITRGSLPNVTGILGMNRAFTCILPLFRVSIAMSASRYITADNHVLLRATSPFEDLVDLLERYFERSK